MQHKNTNTKWCFVVNPAASKGLVGKSWENISKLLHSNGITFNTVFTQRKMHAAKLAADVIDQGCRHLVAVGGDGTAHEVINGIFSQKTCAPTEITFSLLPIGTGNDWVKTHRIPRKLQSWITYFKKGKTTFQDIGKISCSNNGASAERYFINIAGLVFDGHVAWSTRNGKNGLFKSLHYLEMTARTLFGFKTPPSIVKFDGQEMKGRLLTINAGICKYSGGGMQLVPHAIPNDGYLALTIAGNVNPFVVMLIAPLFYIGKIGWHPKVHFFQTKQVVVEPLSNKTVWAEADGEFLGSAPATITILPNALKILVP